MPGEPCEAPRPGTKIAAAETVIFACYLLLASVYLLYLPDAQFVLDDWWLFQHFARAHSTGEMTRAILQNTLWGSYRTNGLSFLAVYGLSGVVGPRPKFYFALGILLHACLGYLLYRTCVRLGFGGRLAFAAGAIFLFLPTVHNPLFWPPACAHYLFSGFWFLAYLHSLAGTVTAGKLENRGVLMQVGFLILALFCGDQVFGLLALAAPILAVCFRSRAAMWSTIVAWGTIATVQSLYARFVNRAPIAGSMHAKFEFTGHRALDNWSRTWSDYRKLAGLGDGYYAVSLIVLGAMIALAVGVFVVWRLHGAQSKAQVAPWRALGLGVLLCLAGYGPVLFLRWRELRYDYLPSLGLALMAAAACATAGRWMPLAAGLLTAYSAASVVAEIQQCWKPQSANLRAIEIQLRALPGVAYHDFVAVSNTPTQIGTAPHFAMFLSYSSTPFVETVTGVWGLVVGRDIVVDSGRLGLEHADFFREIKPEDLKRAYVVFCPVVDRCVTRSLLARAAGEDRYRLFALKNYTGPVPDPNALYSREELRALEDQIYYCRTR